jgi:cardiolipin synthase
LPTAAGWAYFLLVTVLVLVALFRRRETASALGWSLALVFLPGLGILFFLLFGINRLPRRLRRKRDHHQAFAGRALAPATGTQPAKEHPRTRWRDLAAMLEGLEDEPRRGGNATTLYTEGSVAFRDMAQAIEAARHHVHVEFYIFRNDELGRRLTDLLVEKCEAGVEVRVLVDGVGSAGNRRILSRIQRAGGRAERFLRVWPFGKRVTPNLRNHRKIVICDGQTAFFGGLNVGVEYLGRRGDQGEWFDLHMRVRGPAVWDLQRIFVEDWDFCAGEHLDGPAWFPPLEAVGPEPVQILSGGPDHAVNPIRQAYFAAFVRARHSILLCTPYLVPDGSLRDALKMAARSGVTVRIVLPRPPGDNRLASWCGEYYAEELLEAGVRVFTWTPGMLHAKAVVVDGTWAMLGTANLDNRSLHLNFEQMAVLDGPAAVAGIEQALEGVLESCRETTLADLRGLSPLQRAARSGARLLAPLL